MFLLFAVQPQAGADGSPGGLLKCPQLSLSVRPIWKLKERSIKAIKS
jgi:hypothetical protein